MRTKYVAVLDVRSTEMVAVVGERGVNGTFIIKSKYSCEYEGYADGELLDVQSFVSAVQNMVGATLSAMGGISEFYVGVPGEFIKICNVDRTISFPTAKKITSQDCGNLVTLARPDDDPKWISIRHSCLYYVLSDKRKVISPVGAVSDSLQGKFCFYKCGVAFVGVLMDAFKQYKDIQNVNLIPSNYAEAMYLIDPEKRDECAVLFDLGFISSTYSVVCGNGLLFSESFSLGIGHLAVLLMDALDIPYQVAMTYLTTVNLNAKETFSQKAECIYEGQVYSFPAQTLREIIREGLDGICETIEECRQSFTGRNIDGKPLYITGEGVFAVRGATEHIAGRLVKGVEVIAPKLPYYDKPKFSSLFSLLNTALKDANA